MGKSRARKRQSKGFQIKSLLGQKSDYYDYNLVAVIVLLTCFGLVMLYSTSAYMAEIDWGDDMYYFKKQAIISVACIIIALVISKIDYHILSFFTTFLYITSMALMVLVKTPLEAPPTVRRDGLKSDRSVSSRRKLQKLRLLYVCRT